MGLTQSKLALGDLIFDARLCGPEGGAVVVLLHGWPEFSSWWQDSLDRSLRCRVEQPTDLTHDSRKSPFSLLDTQSLLWRFESNGPCVARGFPPRFHTAAGRP